MSILSLLFSFKGGVNRKLYWLALLGVERSPDQHTIRKAYREKMSLYHPDKVSQLGIEIRELADRKSKQINKAYRLLCHTD